MPQRGYATGLDAPKVQRVAVYISYYVYTKTVDSNLPVSRMRAALALVEGSVCSLVPRLGNITTRSHVETKAGPDYLHPQKITTGRARIDACC